MDKQKIIIRQREQKIGEVVKLRKVEKKGFIGKGKKRKKEKRTDV